ncbi:hypothetical protein Syun_023359 [Stephania yunnanensis]|uniref:Uncharacterized protein n=1 Tax=Stephania yunnanensis TaxID=152371 RepID=A0AAP0FML1_9MAGN
MFTLVVEIRKQVLRFMYDLQDVQASVLYWKFAHECDELKEKDFSTELGTISHPKSKNLGKDGFQAIGDTVADAMGMNPALPLMWCAGIGGVDIACEWGNDAWQLVDGRERTRRLA